MCMRLLPGFTSAPRRHAGPRVRACGTGLSHPHKAGRHRQQLCAAGKKSASMCCRPMMLALDRPTTLTTPCNRTDRRRAGQLFGLATTDRRRCTSPRASRDDEGWILKANHEANRLAIAASRILVDTEDRRSQRPAAVTHHPRQSPQFLVVGDLGSLDTPGDSRLHVLHLASGNLALISTRGCMTSRDWLTARRRQLYAVDFAWAEAGRAASIVSTTPARTASRRAAP